MPATIPSNAPANPKTLPVKREEDRVLLDGVEGFNFSEKQCSTLATQGDLMRAVGESISYEDLVGGSALAFRVQAYKASMCPSAAHAMVGQRCETGAFLPWSMKVHFFAKPDAAERAREAALSAARSVSFALGEV